MLDIRRAYEQITAIEDMAYADWKRKHRAFMDYADSFPHGYTYITQREADEMGDLDNEAEFLSELMSKLGEARELIEDWYGDDL
jgi:hypothetical protein